MGHKRLKIAVLVKSFNLYGGMERYAVEVAQRLSKRGHQIDIFAREADCNLLGKMGFTPLTGLFSFSSALGAATLANDAAKKIARGKYDIIHSHERSYCQDVLTAHCFSYKGSLEKYGFCRRQDQRYLSLRNWLYLWLEKRQMRTENIVAVSEVIRNDIKRHYGRSEKVSIVCPGVDTAHYTPSWLADNRKRSRKELGLENEKVILFVGSEFKRKGLDFVFSALQQDMRLLVVGQGDDLEKYKKMARNQGIANKVIFVGHTFDVRYYYAAADLVVLPSQSEAFGMSILEGMACGLPVVTTANTGVSCIIEQGKNGFVVESGADLPQFFQNVFGQKMVPEVGKMARKTAMKYSWETVANHYEELFFEVVSRREHQEQIALKSN